MTIVFYGIVEQDKDIMVDVGDVYTVKHTAETEQNTAKNNIGLFILIAVRSKNDG